MSLFSADMGTRSRAVVLKFRILPAELTNPTDIKDFIFKRFILPRFEIRFGLPRHEQAHPHVFDAIGRVTVRQIRSFEKNREKARSRCGRRNGAQFAPLGQYVAPWANDVVFAVLSSSSF